MIDPLVQLAFNMHSNKGAYAVLLGSGVSRSAGIPTGWEIILDLTRKLAHVYGEESGPNPVDWYVGKFGEQPDYSRLIDAVAKHPAERSQILRGYFEPTPEDRENGLRAPTPAHRAIAQLAQSGHLRVIITTNFDRLIETALGDAGVISDVISTPDAVEGALPLIHSRCSVIKLHGDYLDTRIKNTPDELAQYDPRIQQLLDRILDEFGLIVCGWSAEWDIALRAAITKAPNRRFNTYWASRGTSTQAAIDLCNHRKGQIVATSDANDFFVSIAEKVASLEEMSQPHPLSAELAVVAAKRYLPEERHDIRLHDLLIGEVDRALEAIRGAKLPPPQPEKAHITGVVRAYESALNILLPLLMHSVYWCNSRHHALLAKMFERLMNHERDRRNPADVYDLSLYPATLTLYGMGMAAMETGKLDLLKRLLAVRVRLRTNEKASAVDKLLPALLHEPRFFHNLEGMDKRYVPLNDWLHAVLRPHVSPLLADGDSYTHLFDQLEIVLALSFRNVNSEGWMPPGAFGYRRTEAFEILKQIDESLTTKGMQSFYVSSGLFGESVEAARLHVKQLVDMIPEYRMR